MGRYSFDSQEKSQSEIDINKNLLDIDFIPIVWNNTWGEGREDMIYKLSNIGFQSIMSNSSAFYFDMTDDMDMANPGLNSQVLLIIKILGVLNH